MSDTGLIIYKVRDRYGEIEVIDQGVERILSFGNQARQSVMLRDSPHALPLIYTQAMMTALLFQPQPQKALFLGLGGGTMPSFLLHHYPECQIDCVELRPKVVHAAHTYFNLPADDADDQRLRVYIDDASHFLGSGSQGDYDLLFLDLFCESGPVDCVKENNFLAACRNNLSSHGILICNTWTATQANFTDFARMAREIFPGKMLSLRLGARYNAVVFAFIDPQMLSGLRKRRNAARHLLKKTSINFPGYLRQLIEQNVSLLDRLLMRG
ncbi:MAG: hypothetical protein KQH63_07945 [Desulfobulbaceae bacterium]|nr:hypothetical protein [Desulfobulbaceae bacterium]